MAQEIHQIVITKKEDGRYKIITMKANEGVITDSHFHNPENVLALTKVALSCLVPAK